MPVTPSSPPVRTIEILGPGCPRCDALAANALEATRQLQVPSELHRVTKIDDILRYDVLMTPALVIDGEVKIVGRVPSVEEIKELLRKR